MSYFEGYSQTLAVYVSLALPTLRLCLHSVQLTFHVTYKVSDGQAPVQLAKRRPMSEVTALCNTGGAGTVEC